jgi:3-oxoadipate enol-lactonase
MATLELSPGNSLVYDYDPPTDEGFTVACFNALSGDRGMWTAALGEALRDTGHGLLTYNLRGQAGTEFSSQGFSESSIVADARALLDHVRPLRPVHVGLSIGGLFALKAHLGGSAATAAGLVLINTLRRSGPRLDWLNDAVVRAAEVGGLDLLRDLYSPLLMNEEWQAANRANFLKPGEYRPLAPTDGAFMLLAAGATADWDLPYEAIDVPVLAITGLQDRVFRDEADIEAILARLPRAERLDMADAGHMLPVERPQELAAAIVAFLDGIARRNAAQADHQGR